ncbi:transcription factor 24-like isoform X1 [Acipenser ruthenus]|uniref:transcription factor 24-like isoform X1 n=1 Tax=Acipenser ruthenus TaxID=7906 RepID=UPI002740DF22|nr:transcription factor 24-like isoform X1 [Acipenser ruthenus]
MAERLFKGSTSAVLDLETRAEVLPTQRGLLEERTGYRSHQTHKDTRKRQVGSSFRDQQRVGKFQQYPENAARERSRVRNLRQAFHSLQAALPSVPPDTKLSKLDVLVLATNYIAHLTQILDQGKTLPDRTQPFRVQGYLHPVKKWPMRSHLYSGAMGEFLIGVQAQQKQFPSGEEAVRMGDTP